MKERKTTKKGYIVVLILILVHTLITFVFWSNTTVNIRRDSEKTFLSHTETNAIIIGSNLENYANILYVLRGVYSYDSSLSLDKWMRITNSLSVVERYAGVFGIGFITHIDREEVPAFFEKINREYNEKGYYLNGISGFPEGVLNDNYYLSYTTPFDEENAAIGFNLGAEEKRIEAINLAIDRGTITSTEALGLVNDPDNLPSTLLYLPIYKDYNTSWSWEEKHKNTVGFITMAIQIPKLIDESLKGIKNTKEINIKVFDVTSEEQYKNHGLPVYDNGVETQGNYIKNEIIYEFGGRKWEVEFYANEYYGVDGVSIINLHLIFLSVLIIGYTVIIFFYIQILSHKHIREKVKF